MLKRALPGIALSGLARGPVVVVYSASLKIQKANISDMPTPIGTSPCAACRVNQGGDASSTAK
jgi:hypothetical protein